MLGDFEIDGPGAPTLDRQVDVLWVATKATQLEAALGLAPAGAVGDAVVVPFLNGVDHVERLRERYPSVVAGAIRVESERVATGVVRQTSPFARAELAGSQAIAAELVAAGIECGVRDDERSLLWEKLAFLAPVALATTALDATLGDARGDSRLAACRHEAVAVGVAEGARLDEAAIAALHAGAPPSMRSSMQKDVDAGRVPELDAIAGPILRGGHRHGIDVPATAELAAAVDRRRLVTKAVTKS